jgi:hypothetical protein
MTDEKTLGEFGLHAADGEIKEAEERRAKRRAAATAHREAWLTEHPEYLQLIDHLMLQDVDFLNERPDDVLDPDYDTDGERTQVFALEEANIVSSVITHDKRLSELERGDRFHLLMLDLIPSSTEGHGHLYIDHEISQDDWEQLIALLGKIGIIEEGYAEASLNRGHTDLRLPWERKQ